MSALPKPFPETRTEHYRSIAMTALESADGFRAQAQKYLEAGDANTASEYLKLATEAMVRANRYILLADFTEKTA